MVNINVVLHFSNKKYAESLARGLCYEYTGLNVFLTEDEEEINGLLECGILLTDIETAVNEKTIFFAESKQENSTCISKMSAVKEILKAITSKVMDIYGAIPFFRDDDTRIIGVFSSRGGMGVTSFAITLSRLIAAKTEVRVLYLNLGDFDDYSTYVEVDNSEILCKMQYLFMKEENIKVNIENYCVEDSWGVSYFKPEDMNNSFLGAVQEDHLIKYLTDEKYFAYIIVDYGKARQIQKHLLYGYFEIKDSAIVLWNREEERCQSYERHGDGDSFMHTNGNIEISLNGFYANHIELIIDDSNLLA